MTDNKQGASARTPTCELVCARCGAKDGALPEFCGGTAPKPEPLCDGPGCIYRGVHKVSNHGLSHDLISAVVLGIPLEQAVEQAKSELGQDADSIILLERGQALAEALEIEMDGGGGRSAKSREAIAAWRAETRKEGK